MKLMNQAGFTLVEMLIAMAISLVVGMAAYTVFSTSNWSALTQEGVSEVQQNVRASMARLTHDIHTAGFGVEETPFSMTIGGTTFSSPITVTNSSSGPDQITLLGVGRLAGVLEKAGNCGASPSFTCNSYGNNTVRLDSVADFKDGSGNFVSSRNYISIGGIQTLQLSGTQTFTDNKLALLDNVQGNYEDGDKIPVYILQAIQYSISTSGTPSGCTAANPCLVSTDLTGIRGSGAQVVADGIEDMQFAYGVDVSPRDGKIDFSGPYDAADFQNNPVDDTSIVAVRTTLIGRSTRRDTKGATFTRPAAEDRAAGSADSFRRRSLTKMIMLKNPRSGA